MAQIYNITNDINGKVYIGKTTFSINKRWREHKSDCKRKENLDRPLYRAMNKYGIEHFHISLLETCSRDKLNDREIFWINYFDSYHNGYNATLGGEGSIKYDVKAVNNILNMWRLEDEPTVKDIHNLTGTDVSVIRTILLDNGVTAGDIQLRKNRKLRKRVRQINKETGETIQIFPSAYDAGIAMTGDHTGNPHIIQVCIGKRKSAYGYKWEYEN